MSQTSKRPGARDISDLKARLGLKKGGAASAGGASPAAPRPPGGGIVPPPGANIGGAIPAPPGVQPPPGVAPGQVAVPDASSDPFGAMNAMAQNATAAPAIQPDIVVVNDGKPVESVGAQGKGARIGKMAAMILGPLIAGIMVGKVSAGANQYNEVIADARPVQENVKIVRRGLTELQATLEGSKQGGKFVTGDTKLLDALKALPELKGDDKLVYESALYHLDPAAVAELYGFYSDIHVLNRLLKEHLRRSKVESKALEDGAKVFKGFNPMLYGAVVNIPSADEAAGGKPVTMKMARLGGPICAGETKPNPAGCGGAAPTGFAYQLDQTSGWKSGKLPDPSGETVAGDSVVMLEMTPTLKQVLQGADATVGDVAYQARITEIDAMVTRMLDSGKKLEQALNEKANESGRFSFFL